MFNPTACTGRFLLERDGRFAFAELSANQLSEISGEVFREPEWRSDDELKLANRFAQYRFAPDGTLVEALVDGRPILSGTGQVLTLYYDNPANHDAWNLDPEYRSCPVAQAVAVG